MAKRSAKSTAKSATKDVDYTVPGLITLVIVVTITALLFAQPNVALGANFGGKAYDIGTTDTGKAVSCDASSLCDGSRLVRQGADCQQYIAYCTHGCVTDVKGNAICAS